MPSVHRVLVKMSPVSPVFHTVVTVRICLKILRHPWGPAHFPFKYIDPLIILDFVTAPKILRKCSLPDYLSILSSIFITACKMMSQPIVLV